jgi:hypothetical protein
MTELMGMELLENALMLFEKDMLGSAIPYVSNTMQEVAPYAGMIGGAINALSALLSEASMFGDAFNSLYNKLTGNHYLKDVTNFFKSAYSTTASPQQTYEACSKLSEDIRKALAEAHKAAPPPTIPQTCVAGTIWNCDETYVRDRHTDIKRLQEEIDGLLCQVQGKIVEKEKWETALANCVKKLDKEDRDCKATNTCSSTTNPATTCTTCPFRKKPETTPCGACSGSKEPPKKKQKIGKKKRKKSPIKKINRQLQAIEEVLSDDDWEEYDEIVNYDWY